MRLEDNKSDNNDDEEDDDSIQVIFNQVQIGTQQYPWTIEELDSRSQSEPAFNNFSIRLNNWIRIFLNNPGVISSQPDAVQLGDQTLPLVSTDIVRILTYQSFELLLIPIAAPGIPVYQSQLQLRGHMGYQDRSSSLFTIIPWSTTP